MVRYKGEVFDGDSWRDNRVLVQAESETTHPDEGPYRIPKHDYTVL